MSAQMLMASPLGVGTVRCLKIDQWSMVKGLRQATRENPAPAPAPTNPPPLLSFHQRGFLFIS